MSLNDDVDKLTGRYLRDRIIFWSVIIIGLTISAAAMIVYTGVSRAEPPPMIEDLKRRPVVKAPEPVKEEQADTGTKTVGVGPMCIAEYIAPDHMGVLLEEAPSEKERIAVETAIDKCERQVHQVADPWKVLALHRLEGELGVPKEAEGLLIATWCWEGAMRSDRPIRGDFHGGVAHSFGPFQMQAWFWDWCGLPTAPIVYDDLLIAGTCYWSRVEYMAAKNDCKGEAKWATAEAMAANGLKYKHQGCRAESKHWKELKKWRAM